MNIVYFICGVIFLGLILAAMLFNMNTTATVIWFQNTYVCQTSLVIFLSVILGIIMTLSFWSLKLKKIKSSANKREKDAEKANIQAEESSEKVKVLEAKIETLENALAKALKDSK